MRLYEKHQNGAILDVDGEPERVAQVLIEWRKYQDATTPRRSQPVGFVAGEVKANE